MIFAWLIGKTIAYFKNIKIIIPEWFFLIFGAIFPDIDYLIQWTTGISVHRLITHSLVMIVLGFVLCYFLIYLYNKYFKSNLNAKIISLFFSIGILSHIIADMVMGWPGVPLLWPWDKWFYFFIILAEPFRSIPIQERSIEMLASAVKWAIFDIGLGAAWIFYLIITKKIKEF